jgi:hypothetical protein
MDKHSVLCEITYKAKSKHNKKQNRETEEIEEELPSQKQMYKMLLELALKYNKLEEKVELMSKWVDKKKKKINVLEWLNTNSQLNPEIMFDSICDSNIHILESDVTFIFTNSFADSLNEIFSRCVYNIINPPLFAFIQKANTIYIYTENGVWVELSREKLISFLNKVHFKFVKTLFAWNKSNETKINESDQLSDVYNKAVIKLMSVDFKHEPTLNKIKSSIYNKIKSDMKALIEYEFEF